MNLNDLAREFEAQRARLRAVAYRMLGSASEADDAVQEAWLRLSRSDPAAIENLAAWLTTVVGRVSVDILRTRTARRETQLPDVIVTPVPAPLDEAAVIADSVGLALLVVLDTLAPAERLAFVLHDLFAVPFDEIGPIVGRSPDAAKMLASRARRRVRAAAPTPDADLGRQRQIVDAFLAAAHNGDFAALVALLDPDVELHADAGGLHPGRLIRGAATVAGQAIAFARFTTPQTRPVLINGTPGVLSLVDGHPAALMSFTIAADRIVALHILTDPERLAELAL